MCIVGVGQNVQEPQERVRADWYTGFARQPSATFAAGLECECGQQFGRAVGTASVAGQHAIEALGEDLAWTARHITEPPAAVDSQTHGVTAPGTARAKTVLRRSFDPVPPGTFYASVWADVESTMTLEFEGDFLPRGQVETVFMENAEREPGVVAVAEQVGPPRGRRGSRCRT